jgi:glycosidase
MDAWPNNPLIYEINAWVWLGELARRLGHPVTLGTVPDEEWDALGRLGVDAVWLMGVWERSPLGIRIANENEALAEEFRRVLPDFTEADNVGSPYCVRRYVVDDKLGGPEGLAAARRSLAARGMRLVLDFVPNHVALDHPAIVEHPEYFIRGSREDIERDPQAFFEVQGQVIARGKDPNFPSWPDVAQVNAFSEGLRGFVIDTVGSIAAQCDGMRCDMAILMINDVFRRTWGERAGEMPEAQFWPEVISAVKARHPGVLFIAEAYWDLEAALQDEGFDYCYDKRLYDRLVHGSVESIRLHLTAGIDYQRRLVRFIENHDEPRAALELQPDARRKAAAVVSTTLPGARLLHQGQFEGRKTRIPVFLRRGPEEPVDEGLRVFYAQLLNAINSIGRLRGTWRLCDVTGWDDNQSCQNLLAWAWEDGDHLALIVVNYSETPSQGRVRMPWPEIDRTQWRMRDPMSGQDFERDGEEIEREGLYVDLPAWGTHFLTRQPALQPAGTRTPS